MKFLFSRRWILFALAVAFLAFVAFRLGEWQFHRLEDRESENAVIERNLRADPVPVEDVLAEGRPVAPEDSWRRVTASGQYVEDETIVVRYQTRDGQSGVDVVTPLLTESGTALLVDRGWLETGNVGTTRPDVPPAPEGEVTVTGWVRADAEGDSAEVADRSTRAISSVEIAPTLPFPVYGGFVDLEAERPEPATPLARTELPDLGEGPHFFYGLQWWFFAALALFGFCYLAWDERRKARRAPTSPGKGATAQPIAGEKETAGTEPQDTRS
ncbi:MAG TPA: SURF1 family protein [Nocardioidaceae bacterium]|nr:SURF1 family protein [Nocardioidaceae bacterium]HSE70652.1 SURF1 family protein [Nocardioidaceae bacterium]